ncbi:extracellular solute-binding protein [Neobacillus sp. NPDC097160]|uniref:extracellular solute-binding protein n=1 Tax=Neobacillus sp. NPDC097160 TaxID=3364298 RepID=UPI0038281BBD
MKKSLSLFVIVLMIAALSACGNPTPQKPGDAKSAASTEKGGAKQITISGNGGKIEKVIRDIIAPKFKEKTGIQVNYISGLSGEILSKVELQKNAPQIDIAFFVPIDVQRANEKGLIENIDEKMVPNMKNVDKDFVALQNVAAPAFGLVIAPAYNTEVFKQKGIAPIESWNDLIRPDYKGKTAFADIGNDWGFNILYNLAIVNGGSIDNLEPGLKKAKELAGYSSTFYKNSTQMMPAIQQGAADVTVMGSYVIADLAVNSGIPLKMVVPKEGVNKNAFSAAVVKNSPHSKEAAEFVNYLISEESQKAISEEGFYPVVNGMDIPDKYKDIIGLKDTDKTYTVDINKLAKIRGEWTDRWTKEVTPELGKLLK